MSIRNDNSAKEIDFSYGEVNGAYVTFYFRFRFWHIDLLSVSDDGKMVILCGT